jgi:glycine cleavage system H protein
MAGTIERFNAELLNDPSRINVDNYGSGWLFELTGDLNDSLTVEQYHEFLAEAWPQTQRLIKGQMNSADDE